MFSFYLKIEREIEQNHEYVIMHPAWILFIFLPTQLYDSFSYFYGGRAYEGQNHTWPQCP